jgi:serine/threonine protein kinase
MREEASLYEAAETVIRANYLPETPTTVFRPRGDDHQGPISYPVDLPKPGPRLLAGDIAWEQIATAQVFDTKDHPVPERLLAAAPASREYDITGPVTGASFKQSSDFGSAPQQQVPHSTVRDSESSARERPTLVPGSMVAGRYQVKAALGAGGFANIYLVTDTEDYLQEEIVLKVVDETLMRSVLEMDGHAMGRHVDLIKAWRSKLKAWKIISEQAPNQIVRLLGVPRIIIGRDTDYRVGILMEHMRGGDLWRYHNSKGVPRNREHLMEVLRHFLDAGRAVGVLHKNRLLHRDIKPANFLLDAAQDRCKLSDFELITEINDRTGFGESTQPIGTPIYMAPECFIGQYSVQSDIFALGAALYHLLTGQHPRSNWPSHELRFYAEPSSQRPEPPMNLNPLVSAELSDVILRCLNSDPSRRPSSVDELQDELKRLGLTEDADNIAPVNLARLMLNHLSNDDVHELVATLEENGLRSASTDPDQRQRDIVEEYCYTVSPYDVLKENCTTRQLKALNRSLGLECRPDAGRDVLIEQILTSVGFLTRVPEVPGIEANRLLLENLLLNLAHATTMDECVGKVQAGISAVERTVDLLLSFFGQLLWGAVLPSYLRKTVNGRPGEKLTFSEKLAALRALCLEDPPSDLSARMRNVFTFPLITADIFQKLEDVVSQRTLFSHSPHDLAERSLTKAQRAGRQLLERAVASLNAIALNPNTPRVVQIVSRQDDIYGRHFYLGRDDRGRSERVFTPLPLNVGRFYLFYPLTNPARINPLIFPIDANATTRVSGANPSS